MASLPYPRSHKTIFPQNSRNTQKRQMGNILPQIAQKFLAQDILPQIAQKFLAQDILPQIAQIFTD